MKRWAYLTIPTVMIIAALHSLLVRTRSAPLFYLLFPGECMSLLITGGHGGTHAEDFIAPIAGVITNSAIWITILYLASKWIRGKASSPR